MRLAARHRIFDTNAVNADSVYAVCFLGEYDFLRDFLHESDVVADVGANIGAYSVVVSSRVKRVYAVEPNRETFRFLLRNIRLNNCANVIPVNAAVSDRVGLAHLDGKGESAHLGSTGAVVRTTTLERIGKDITVLKLDVEGAELLALRRLSLLRDVRLIAVETHGNLDQVTKVLADRGFQTATFSIRKSDMFRRAANIDFLRDEVRTRFSVSKRAARLLLHAPHPLFVPAGILYGIKKC